MGVLSKRQASAQLGVSARTVERLIATGRLNAHKIRPGQWGRVRITRDSIDRFLSETAVPAGHSGHNATAPPR